MIEGRRNHDLRAIAARFDIEGDFLEAAPHGGGHINDTYAARFGRNGSRTRYIFQRINPNVFKNPAALMENIGRVTAHIRAKLAAQSADELERRVLTLVPAREGGIWWMDDAGSPWRCYRFIEGASSYDQIASPAQAREAARAFGAFQKLLADLPAPRLHDTIPNFHHTRSRFDALRRAIEADACNRAVLVKPEIEFCLRRERMVDVLLDLQARGLATERITHNDTKLNNVMFDDATGEGICVIDLDTVMPGLALYDFGDMCRTACHAVAEDERDLSKVALLLDVYEALVRGYLGAAGDVLNATEREHLGFSARLITFEMGLRFLADYLQGDPYYKIHREGHNVDRARIQFKIIESFERHEEAMNRVVRDAGS